MPTLSKLVYPKVGMPNKRMRSDKKKLRRFALQLYFSGDAKRFVVTTDFARFV